MVPQVDITLGPAQHGAKSLWQNWQSAHTLFYQVAASSGSRSEAVSFSDASERLWASSPCHLGWRLWLPGPMAGCRAHGEPERAACYANSEHLSEDAARERLKLCTDIPEDFHAGFGR